MDDAPVRPIRDLRELQESGLLWLINRVVFHPRGWALGLATNEAGEVVGWRLQGDGTEPWHFELPDGEEDDLFRRAEQTLRRDG